MTTKRKTATNSSGLLQAGLTWVFKQLCIPTFLILSLIGCGSLLDISGKGSQTKCLYLLTDSLKIKYDCDDRKLTTITVYENKNQKEIFGKVIFKDTLEIPINEFVLPFNRDSADNKFLQIEIHITKSHFRETYYIETKPGDFALSRHIYARYFSH